MAKLDYAGLQYYDGKIKQYSTAALNSEITKIKSGSEEDAVYHLGFYLDENGDLCQVDDE